MEAAIKKLIATITSMATKLNCENINPNSGDSGSSERDSRHPQMKKLQNRGAYCISHGFHPVGINHDSAT